MNTTSALRSSRLSLPSTIIIGALALAILAGAGWWFRPRPVPTQIIQETFNARHAELDSAITRLQQVVDTRQPGPVVQAAFRQTRLAYKRLEWLTAYYSPLTTKALNGPNIQTVDDDYRTINPQGFQVIEELIFPEYDLTDTTKRADVQQQLAILRVNAKRLAQLADGNVLTDSHIFDACRLEVFRIMSLGITGFDSPVAFQSLPEAVAALDGVREALTAYPLADRQPVLAASLDRAFSEAIRALQQSQDFDRFDRLTFIRNQANPLSALLLDAQLALNISNLTDGRLLSASARTLTEPGIFDPNFFTNLADDRATPDRIALGKMLFYDPILSGKSGRSCATCHDPKRAFTDGETKSLATGFGGRRIARNAPTLFNVGLQAVQFADSRVAFLEDQASDVIQNRDEMHGSLPAAIKFLSQHPLYARQFARTYKTGVTEQTLKNTIASYMRSLVSLDSRVDQYLRGKPVALTADEQLGFNVFMGKGKCATCHFFPLFNGTVPPAYQETESEVLGTPATLAGKQVDPDPGKFVMTKNAVHRYAFKTPTVRFSGQTAPYMHNGVYRTLNEVIDFYDKGGGNGMGFNLPNQTLPFDKLNLTPAEKQGLVAFMRAL